MGNYGAGMVCLMVMLCFAVPCLATVYTVGDSAGWTLGVDYTTWASGKTFNVGDSLVFNYGSSHNVDEVSESDYSGCTVGNSITTDSSGATTIPLKTAGTHHFICGVVGHCSGGMKLAVTVAGGSTTAPAGSTPPSLTGPPTTTTTTTSPAPPTTTTTPSGTVPESSSALTLSPFVAVWVALFSKLVILL
ncbi:hypothetical protein LguiB_019767 [Lonicera macranthoides]